MGKRKYDTQLVAKLREEEQRYLTMGYSKREICRRLAEQVDASWRTIYAWLSPGYMKKAREKARQAYHMNPVPTREYKRQRYHNALPESRVRSREYKRLYLQRPYAREKARKNCRIYLSVRRHFRDMLPSVFSNDDTVSVEDLALRLADITGKRFLQATLQHFISECQNCSPPPIVEVQPKLYRLNDAHRSCPGS